MSFLSGVLKKLFVVRRLLPPQKWTPFVDSMAGENCRRDRKSHIKTIRGECNKLANMPNCTNVKALVNHEHQYRLRVGNFRVFFDFDGAARIVWIEEVKKRDEHTY